jgi:hypothetical protein
MDTNYTLSDIRAATRDGYEGADGFGGGSWMWLILVFFLFGNGGYGFGGNRQNEIQQGFDTAEITRKLDGLANGLCDGFYAQNTTMLQGFAGVTAAVENARFDMQKCCCDLSTAIHAEGEATRNLIQQNEIQALRDKVADLSLAQSQCAQNAYLINQLKPCAVPAYITCSPYTTFNGLNGCGCNNI